MLHRSPLLFRVLLQQECQFFKMLFLLGICFCCGQLLQYFFVFFCVFILIMKIVSQIAICRECILGVALPKPYSL